MNSTFIDHINAHLTQLFENYTGSKVYGLAQSVVKKTTTGQKIIPCVVDKYGEGKEVVIDTSVPIQVYHKAVTLGTSWTGNGFGDSKGDIRNLHGNVMVVYLNRKKTNLLPDELFLYIQAKFPDDFEYEGFQVDINITSVILNTLTVINSEYQGIEINLGPEHNLFAINYTIESKFQKDCFEKCPKC